MTVTRRDVARNFSRRGFTKSLYGNNLRVYFLCFFLKNSSKLRKFFSRGEICPLIPPTGYALSGALPVINLTQKGSQTVLMTDFEPD